MFARKGLVILDEDVGWCYRWVLLPVRCFYKPW